MIRTINMRNLTAIHNWVSWDRSQLRPLVCHSLNPRVCNLIDNRYAVF
jgi:hypothetical protein